MGTFKKLLQRNGKAILKDRGERIERSAKREYDKVVVALEAELDEITDEMELMLDQNPRKDMVDSAEGAAKCEEPR